MIPDRALLRPAVAVGVVILLWLGYTALQTLARARPAGSKPRDKPWRTGDVYHPSWQRPDGQTGWAVWRVGEPAAAEATQEIRIQGPLREAFNHLGEPVDLNLAGGRARRALGHGPVYLIGPSRLEVGARDE